MVAFTFVAFALMGLGLVIATLADNVPAVQALGQCIFLPMLIIGGVAVQLTSLPEWAQHVSAFFPGRYAVEAMQASVTGAGLGVMRFSLLALLLTALAGFVAGIRMFRWDAQQRFVERGGKAWVALALAAWATVGLLAEARGRIGPVAITAEYTPPAQPDERLLPRASTPAAPQPEPVPPAPAPTPGAASPPADARPAAAPEKPPADAARPAPGATPEKPPAPKPQASTPPPAAANAQPPAKPSTTGPPEPLLPEPASWQQVTPAHIEEVMFERLPSDSGVVSPIARADEPMEPELETELEEVRTRLVTWTPARVADSVQRVRNLLRGGRSRRLPDSPRALLPAHRVRTAPGRHAEGRPYQDPLLGCHASGRRRRQRGRRSAVGRL